MAHSSRPCRYSRFRKLWGLKPRSVFLNHGSFGACPTAILNLQMALRKQMEAEPVQFLWRNYDERLDAARTTVAGFVEAEPQDLVFVTNSTTAVNAVLDSVELRPGDEILTTDHNYNACHNVLLETARRTGAKVIVAQVPFPIASAKQAGEAVLAAVTKCTRLVFIDHVTSSTALVFPVKRLVRELERRGVDTLVDGAHAPGMVALDLKKMSPAYYAANLHKWVCAPKGAAFLWARPDKQSNLQPAVISHGNNTPRPGYSSFQDRFDWAGTADPTAWFCAGHAIEWLDRLRPGGWRGIRQTNRAVALQARRLLCERLGVVAPSPESMIASMATLPLPHPFQDRPKQSKIDPEQLTLYDDFGIEVPLFRIGKPERRYFRISAHVYNSLSEYQYLGQALERSAKLLPRIPDRKR